MPRFRLLDSRRSKDIGHAELTVEWLEGSLAAGDSFVVYDTHHPINVSVVDSIPQSKGAILRCAVILGWDGQFARSVVDTDASGRRKAFRYETDADLELPHIRTSLHDGRVVVEIDDDELCDFVEDFLTENCNLINESKSFGAAQEPSRLTFPANVDLGTMFNALRRLDPAEVERVFVINNPVDPGRGHR
jgi:hypothetical protein